jgi:hypothetical protein
MRGHDIMELNKMMEVVIDDLNEVFGGMLVAEFKNDLLILTLSTRKHVEPWQLDEQLSGALEYVVEKYDMDFNVVGFGKRSVAYEIYQY